MDEGTRDFAGSAEVGEVPGSPQNKGIVMGRFTMLPFDPEGKYKVRHRLLWNGTLYEWGATFPWKRLHCSQRKLKQLYNARMIELVVD